MESLYLHVTFGDFMTIFEQIQLEKLISEYFSKKLFDNF